MEHPFTETPEALLAYVETIIEHRSVPGVMAFSPAGALVYMNAEAERLNHQIAETPAMNGSHPDLPPVITKMCLELQQTMSARSTLKGCEHVELRRVTGSLKFPVLLRGFLLPDSAGNGGPRFLILMEKVGRQSRIIPAQSKERYHLTDREQEIVKHIADGRTNKEIASLLSISEHTVKEHVRHLLRKTKTSTRTAVVARVFQDS